MPDEKTLVANKKKGVSAPATRKGSQTSSASSQSDKPYSAPEYNEDHPSADSDVTSLNFSTPVYNESREHLVKEPEPSVRETPPWGKHDDSYNRYIGNPFPKPLEGWTMKEWPDFRNSVEGWFSIYHSLDRLIKGRSLEEVANDMYNRRLNGKTEHWVFYNAAPGTVIRDDKELSRAGKATKPDDAPASAADSRSSSRQRREDQQAPNQHPLRDRTPAFPINKSVLEDTSDETSSNEGLMMGRKSGRPPLNRVPTAPAGQASTPAVPATRKPLGKSKLAHGSETESQSESEKASDAHSAPANLAGAGGPTTKKGKGQKK